MKIKNKIIINFTFLFIAIYIAIGVLTYFNILKSFSVIIDKDVEKTINSKSESISFYIEGLANEMLLLAENPSLSSNNEEEIKNVMNKNLESRKSRISNLFFSDLEGNFYTTNGKKGNIAETEYFKEITRQGSPYVISRPVKDETSGNYVFYILATIKNTNGEKIGVLGESILLETISNLTSDIKIGENGYGWITDDIGTMIAHPIKSERFNLNLLRTDKIKMNKKDAEQIIIGEKASVVAKSKDGTDLFIISKKLKNTPSWTLGISVPLKEKYGTANRIILETVIYIWF